MSKYKNAQRRYEEALSDYDAAFEEYQEARQNLNIAEKALDATNIVTFDGHQLAEYIPNDKNFRVKDAISLSSGEVEALYKFLADRDGLFEGVLDNISVHIRDDGEVCINAGAYGYSLGFSINQETLRITPGMAVERILNIVKSVVKDSVGGLK